MYVEPYLETLTFTPFFSFLSVSTVPSTKVIEYFYAFKFF